MSTHQQLIALANAIAAYRPDWQQAGILSQLRTLNDTWAGADGALAVHAMTIAAHPQARTPAAFNAGPPPEPPTVHTPKPHGAEPVCYTCTLPRSQCAARRVLEESRGLETHDFETREDAEHRISKRQLS
jgi:hypothetical protein